MDAYERNLEARRRSIEHHGARCVDCGLDFGVVAEGLIHVHHLKRIGEVGEGYIIDPVEDLRPVCPYCHAVIHFRSGRPYLVEDVRAFLRPVRRRTTNLASRVQ